MRQIWEIIYLSPLVAEKLFSSLVAHSGVNSGQLPNMLIFFAQLLAVAAYMLCKRKPLWQERELGGNTIGLSR